MATEDPHVRLSIDLDPRLRARIEVAAARTGVSVGEYCADAIRRRLAEESPESRAEPDPQASAAAVALDRLRRKVGRIGIPVRQLIDEGRR